MKINAQHREHHTDHREKINAGRRQKYHDEQLKKVLFDPLKL